MVILKLYDITLENRKAATICPQNREYDSLMDKLFSRTFFGGRYLTKKHLRSAHREWCRLNLLTSKAASALFSSVDIFIHPATPHQLAHPCFPAFEFGTCSIRFERAPLFIYYH